MQRRTILESAAAAALPTRDHTPLRGLLLACAGATGALADDRPNLLFIFSDDHAAHAISAYGSTRNETPNIDRLAREGLLFENCFCGNSICGPSRATVLTGLHSHANGFIDNRSSFDGSQQTFPKLLQAAGYQTAIVGKWHLRTDPTGFDHWEVLVGQGPYYNPPIKSAAGTTKHEGYTTEVITDLSLAWLREQRDPDRPFLLMYQHKAPHRNWQPGPRELGMYEGVTFEEPATLFDDWSQRNSGCQDQTMTVAEHLTRSDLKLQAPGNLTPDQRAAWDAWYVPQNEAFEAAKLEGDDLVRWKYQRYMQDYMASIAAVDRGVGQVLDALEELELADDTLVVYSADQGFYLGEHGWYDKRWMYEESLRMPLIARWPGRIAPGTHNTKLIQNIDFAPTLLALAGVTELPEPMHGRSFAPMLRGEEVEDWRHSIYYHYYEFPGAHSVPRHHGVRTETHKLIRYEQLAEWELFDLRRDPDELRSVAHDPEYAEVRASLEAELARLAVHYGEPDPQELGQVMDQGRARRRAAKVKPSEVFHLTSAADASPPSPDLSAKPFTVAALVDAASGVVAAQGGASFGYALRLEGRAPVVSLTNRDQRFEVRGEALPTAPAHLAASLDARGRLRLFVDGREVAQGAAQVLEENPADGLTVGRDGGSPVGAYPDEQPLQGSWSHLRFAWGAEHDLAAWARDARGE
jgi:arylsulfatase A-like enzyme